MNKKQKLKINLSWIFFGIFIFFGLFSTPFTYGNILWFIAALITMPTMNILSANKSFKVVLIAFLFFSGIAFSGSTETTKQPNNSTISNEVDDENDIVSNPNASKPIVNAVDNKNPDKNENTTINSYFKITFLDVGQADAALIECDDKYMLIDGGNRGDSDLIYTVLKNKNIKHLDLVVGTHAHEDHIGGLSGALNYATAELILCSTTSYDSTVFSNFKKYSDKNDGIIVPKVGDTYYLGSAKILILGVNSTSDANNSSIVLKIVYGNTAFLFTGDAEREAEQVILNKGYDLSADVIKVGHHGSDTSSIYPFIREVMPDYAVISVGKDNSYGHPHDNTLSRFKDAGSKIYRTDLQGDIICTSNGNNITFKTEKTVSEDNLFIAGNSSTNSKPNNDNIVDNNSTKNNSYTLNTNTMKFHDPDCRYAKSTKDKNKEYFTGLRDELIKSGYEPCQVCNP